MIGYVKWAFVLAFWHLRQATGYEAAIRDTIGRAGDTDTNAAIVGGLMGALHGVQAIPKHMRDAVMGYRYAQCKLGHARPPEVTPADTLEAVMEKLMVWSPCVA